MPLLRRPALERFLSTFLTLEVAQQLLLGSQKLEMTLLSLSVIPTDMAGHCRVVKDRSVTGSRPGWRPDQPVPLRLKRPRSLVSNWHRW